MAKTRNISQENCFVGSQFKLTVKIYDYSECPISNRDNGRIHKNQTHTKLYFYGLNSWE